MAQAFADASALVKRYLDEEGADLVRSASELVLAAFTRVEVASALWRRHRAGELTVESTWVLLDAFEIDWYGSVDSEPVFAVVGASPAVLDRAAVLTGRHGLRAGDAVQLASALATRSADPECTTFLCFDQRLRLAARHEDFSLLPTEL